MAGLLLAALAVAAILLFFSNSEATARVRYVSPRGSDHNPGTKHRPWRTIRHAARRVRPGDVVIVRAGEYGRLGTKFTLTRGGLPGHPVTFLGAPGPLPKVRGRVQIAGAHIRVARLDFVGPTGHVSPRTSDNPGGEDVVVWLTGSDIELRSSTVAGGAWHAGVFVQGGKDIRLVDDRILKNGAFSRPDQANLDHGIYWAQGSGSITGCTIAANLASGIQLYPTATSVAVTNNVIIGNGKAGVLVSGGAARNLIANNKIIGNKGPGIQVFGLTGAENVATANVISGNLNNVIPPELMP